MNADQNLDSDLLAARSGDSARAGGILRQTDDPAVAELMSVYFEEPVTETRSPDIAVQLRVAGE